MPAKASKHKAISYERLVDKQKVLAQEVSDLLAEAKTVDATEDAKFGPGQGADELPVELANRQARAEAMAIARASLEKEAAVKVRAEAEEKGRDRGDDDEKITAAGNKAAKDAVPRPKAQRNFTDPDARIMKQASGAFSYCYNAQAVVDEHGQVIVAAELNQAANDYGELVPMAKKVWENLGGCPSNGWRTPGTARRRTWSRRGAWRWSMAEFFISTGRMKHSDPIPKAPRGRIPANATVGERMARKLKTKVGKKVCSRRKAIVEPVFGQIHTRQGKHLLLRGLEKAALEWKVLAACHNLMKLHSFRGESVA